MKCRHQVVLIVVTLAAMGSVSRRAIELPGYECNVQ